jgi:DNA polymerase elongation subunit (family B)
MASAIGWLLDVIVDGNAATLWIKTIDGGILRLSDEYQPSLYVLPTNERTGLYLFHTLSQQPKINRVEWQDKCADIFDEGDGMRRLLCIYLESIYYYKTLLKRLDKDQRVAQVFNTDLSYIQQYLFTRLKIEPTSKVRVEYDSTDLRSITKIDEHDDVQQPPFTILYFEVTTFSSFYSLDSHDVNDPIKKITARYQEEQEVIFADDEETIIEDFCDYVLTNDPDILISVEHCIGTCVLEYLIARIEELGIDIKLGRTDKRNAIEGRVHLESDSFDNLVELIEKARFACLPLSLAARCRISRLIDSRNCYELMPRGFVISPNHRLEPIRTIEEIFACDKGGMIISPKLGLHENVAVLDYENEYANLILKYNLSYEDTSNNIKGLLPSVVESVLNRLILFKNLQKSFPINTKEWLLCEQRIEVLKSIHVSLYGTTGSHWNRLANVETFEEINTLSRQVLMRTKDIVQGLGYTLLYADTDSVFLKKDGATLEDFISVKDILAKDIGIPISLECYYRYLVLLPLEADEKIEAFKHYYGITHNNELIARGIEIRRHDAPAFIKDFQTELLYTLFDCNDTTEVLLKGYENALLVVTRTIDKVITGELQVKDLVVSKILRQDLRKYKSLFPHVAAALQLSEAGVPLTRGDTIHYLYTNAFHSNPLLRVKPLSLIEDVDCQDYDKNKYREMLLDAAETILSSFGFSRSLYGDTSRRNNRKW